MLIMIIAGELLGQSGFYTDFKGVEIKLYNTLPDSNGRDLWSLIDIHNVMSIDQNVPITGRRK